ncbi:hypothetical protein JYG23_12230 [Sedimentibacter sp. zth1]|uniref:hypothetical protein n=1 Tax=Sedimentibacter sp. zth1 TaxID=2816908 RepID=UPI001A930178|nr:hypothetical protein [Sedimentibacter sp. zth1]QSX05436.1 hypothetical protein JYG23_12230 [Sedimentibacter sp. zth1]
MKKNDHLLLNDIDNLTEENKKKLLEYLEILKTEENFQNVKTLCCWINIGWRKN